MTKDVYLLDYHLDHTKQMLYAPLYNYCVLLDKSVNEERLEVHYEHINKLEPIEVKTFENNISELALSLTEICNLKCRYCYAHGGHNDGRKTSSKELIKPVLEKYFMYLKTEKQKKCSITFNGGCEATCAFDLMRYAVEEANELASLNGIEVSYSMTTNGYFDEEVLGFVVKHFNAIALSFDGPETIQNYHRPTISYGSSFERVFRTAKVLHDSVVDLSIHSIVTNFNVDYLEVTLEFFEKHFPGSRIYFGPMDETEYASEVKPPNEEIYLRRLKQLEKISYNLKWKTVTNNAFKGLKSIACMSIAKPNWFVKIDGQINACMRDTHSKKPIFNIGHYDKDSKKLQLDYGQLNYLKTFNIYEQEECQLCFAKYICGGGCPYLREKNLQKCDLIRNEALDYINEEYENQKRIAFIKDLFQNLHAE